MCFVYSAATCIQSAESGGNTLPDVQVFRMFFPLILADLFRVNLRVFSLRDLRETTPALTAFTRVAMD